MKAHTLLALAALAAPLQAAVVTEVFPKRGSYVGGTKLTIHGSAFYTASRGRTASAAAQPLV